MRTKLISLIATLLLLTPLASSAQTNDATMQALLKQIQALRQQLANLQGNHVPLPSELPPLPLPPLPPVGDQPDDQPPQNITFNRNLYLGLRNDSDVSNLQEFLIDQGFLKGSSSGNYFILTQKAVKKFQSAHNLKPTGYFGPATRAVANDLLAGIGNGGDNGGGSGGGPGAINNAPQINEFPSVPSNIQPGQGVSFSWHATDADNDNLSWSVDWGDGTVAESACPVPMFRSQGANWTFVQSHTWSNSGTYTVKATVSDCRGGTNMHVFVVSVGQASNNLPPVIFGLKAPTVLRVGESGTWTIQARDPENGSLSYRVTWGDENRPLHSPQPTASAQNTSQTSTFTHTYMEGGTFTPTFEVTDQGGLSAKTSASVVVGSAVTRSLTLTAPNGGQQWQINSLHTITWTPYDPNSGINPAKDVTAYLERLVNGQYVTVGKIIEAGKASIHWIGEIDTYGNYPPPGDYYIRIVNNRTGESDRSDNPFTLVPAGTLGADIKVNGSDGPITIPAGGADYVVSWQSRASSCSIYNNAASDSGGAQLTNLRPIGSQVMHFTENSQAYAQYISLECLSKSPIEGSASDNVQLLPSAAPLTILSPNGGENIDLSQSYAVTWKVTADIGKVSIALYKNDKWFAWITPSYAVSAGKNFYTWTPSQTISQSDIGSSVFKIYMIGYKNSGGTVEDKSDAPFSIVTTGTGGTFSIADVAGVQSTYVPGQQIKLTVKGIESDGSPATSGEGFNIQTYIYDSARTKTYTGVNGAHNASTGYWDVVLTAPSDVGISYDLNVILYCANDSAVCASKYGRAAQIEKLFKFTLGSSISNTDLRGTGITKETFHPYGFNATFCVDGSQSINDLKKTNPGLTGFPFDYAVYDVWGNKYQRQVGVSGTPEDLKYGQCSTFGWTIQQQEQGYYDQSKKVELILDPANLVAETNESNNSLIFVEPKPSLPDLAPVSMTIDPSIPIVGKPATLTVVFTNKGGSTASNINFSTDLGGSPAVSSAAAGNNCVNGMTLASGAQCSIVLNVTYSSPVTSNTVRTTIDIDNIVKESDENNNTTSIMSQVIQPSTTVISPNGGEKWPGGSTQNILWSGGTGVTDIYLYSEVPNASCGFCNFTRVIAVGIPTSPGKFVWNIPTSLAPGGNYYIRLSGGSPADNSDGPFSIVSPASPPVILAPNGGESLVIGSPYDVRWRSPVANFDADVFLVVAGFPQAYPIYYTTAVTAGDVPNRWTVGVLASGTIVSPGSYYIKVCQRSTTNCDQSDGTFMIVSSSTPAVGLGTSSGTGLASVLSALQVQLNRASAKLNAAR
ncbi:MAG: peptidoglycan-binding protein [Candidatus Sungbacteria bacterium]|nr:peptidoglycan-binding protein [Candidatus Sungbacteria bacterium]